MISRYKCESSTENQKSLPLAWQGTNCSYLHPHISTPLSISNIYLLLPPLCWSWKWRHVCLQIWSMNELHSWNDNTALWSPCSISLLFYVHFMKRTITKPQLLQLGKQAEDQNETLLYVSLHCFDWVLANVWFAARILLHVCFYMSLYVRWTWCPWPWYTTPVLVIKPPLSKHTYTLYWCQIQTATGPGVTAHRGWLFSPTLCL